MLSRAGLGTGTHSTQGPGKGRRIPRCAAQLQPADRCHLGTRAQDVTEVGNLDFCVKRSDF